MEENSGKEKSKGILYGIGTVIVLIVVVALAGAIGTEVTKEVIDSIETSNGIPNSLLTEAASELNKLSPYMVDSETRFDNSLGINNSMIYNYTLINYGPGEIEPSLIREELKPKTRNITCSSPQMDTFRKYSVLLVYNYYDNTGSLITSFDVDLGSCS